MEEINIRTVSPSYSRRRSSGLGNGIVRVIFFLLMIIPTCIVAYRIDLVNPRQQHVVIQQPAPQQQPTPPPERPAPRRVVQPRVVQIVPAVETIEREPLDIVPYDGPDRQIPERETGPQQLVRLNLETKLQRANVALSGPLRVARLNGAPHIIKPDDGTLSGAVEVSINGPRPILLTVSIDERNGSRTLIIEPTVTTDDGRTIPFTTKNLKLILARIVKNGKRSASQLAAMKAERDQLQAWVDAPVIKPLVARNDALLRIKRLDISIKEGETIVASLEAEARTAQGMAAMAEQLHGEAVLVIESVADGEYSSQP